jgi:hypothetical protein
VQATTSALSRVNIVKELSEIVRREVSTEARGSLSLEE